MSRLIGERAAIGQVAGYRIVALDSLPLGKACGRMSQAKLDCSHQVLAKSAPNGAILPFHDQPIALDVNVQRPLGLRNASDLGEAIRNADAWPILRRHFYLQTFGPPWSSLWGSRPQSPGPTSPLSPELSARRETPQRRAWRA